MCVCVFLISRNPNPLTCYITPVSPNINITLTPFAAAVTLSGLSCQFLLLVLIFYAHAPGLDKHVPICQHFARPRRFRSDSIGLCLLRFWLRGVLMKHLLFISYGSAYDAAWCPMSALGVCGQCIVTKRACSHTCVRRPGPLSNSC